MMMLSVISYSPSSFLFFFFFQSIIPSFFHLLYYLVTIRPQILKHLIHRYATVFLPIWQILIHLTYRYATAFPPIWLAAAASLGFFHPDLPAITAAAATVNSLYSYLVRHSLSSFLFFSFSFLFLYYFHNIIWSNRGCRGLL